MPRRLRVNSAFVIIIMYARSFVFGIGESKWRRRMTAIRPAPRSVFAPFPTPPPARAHERALINLIRDAIGISLISDRLGGLRFHRLTWNQQSLRSREFCVGRFRRSDSRLAIHKINDSRSIISNISRSPDNRSSRLTEAKVHSRFMSGVRVIVQNLPRKSRSRRCALSQPLDSRMFARSMRDIENPRDNARLACPSLSCCFGALRIFAISQTRELPRSRFAPAPSPSFFLSLSLSLSLSDDTAVFSRDLSRRAFSAT